MQQKFVFKGMVSKVTEPTQMANGKYVVNVVIEEENKDHPKYPFLFVGSMFKDTPEQFESDKLLKTGVYVAATFEPKAKEYNGKWYASNLIWSLAPSTGMIDPAPAQHAVEAPVAPAEPKPQSNASLLPNVRSEAEAQAQPSDDLPF